MQFKVSINNSCGHDRASASSSVLIFIIFSTPLHACSHLEAKFSLFQLHKYSTQLEGFVIVVNTGLKQNFGTKFQIE